MFEKISIKMINVGEVQRKILFFMNNLSIQLEEFAENDLMPKILIFCITWRRF